MRDPRSHPPQAVLAGFGIVAGLFSYSLCLARVHGQSMEPTFYTGQWLLVRRLNWPAFPLRDGDVIVLRRDGETLVKRVAALPGERPPLADLRLLRYLRPDQAARDAWLAREVAKLTAPVPEGHLYVLGDNADVSEDSRVFGSIPGSAVIGRVIRWKIPDPPERMPIGYVPTRGLSALTQAATTRGAGRTSRHENPITDGSRSSPRPEGPRSIFSAARKPGGRALRARLTTAKV